MNGEGDMGLKDKISKDVTTALKAGEKHRASTLRLLLSAIKNKEIEKRSDLEDAEIEALIQTLVRQRNDSIELFRKGNRADLAEKEEAEIEMLKAYLPEQLGPEEIEAVVRETAVEAGASGMKDMGRLMKEVMPKLKGRADGRAVNEIVKKVLGG